MITPILNQVIKVVATATTGVIAILVLSNISRAAVVYDSSSFESPRFVVTQSLAGQDPVPPPVGYGPWHQDLGTSAAVVQTDIPDGGQQSIKVTRVAGASGDTRWGINVPITPTAASNVVAIDFDLQAIINPGTNWGGPDLGPLFGVECYDASSGTAKLIGSLFLDAYAGDVVYQQATNGTLQATRAFIPRNEYHHYTLAANFTRKTCSIYVDGNLIHTEGFVDPTAATFTDAPITTLAATSNFLNQAIGTAYFDNYTISATTSHLNYLVWLGDDVNNLWDTGTSSNWFNGNGPDVFGNNTPVVFDDTGSSTPSINLQGTLQPASLMVNASQSYTFAGSGSISGSTSLTKRGSGTLTLAGNNSYTGGTTVSNGVLETDNTTGSATGNGPIFIGSGGTLTGSGSIAGAVTVTSGGTLSPGNGAGTLTLNNNLTLNGDSTLQFELGAASDHLDIGGNLVLGGVLNITGSGGFAPGTYTLMNYGGTLSGSLFIASKPAGYDCALNTNVPGQVNLVVSLPPAPPAAPGGLTALAVSDSQVDLAWVDNSSNETAFFIERSPNNSAFTQIASVGAGVTNYPDTGLSSSTTYYYRIRAGNSGGNSPYSSTVTATTLISTAPPAAYYKFEMNPLDSSGNNDDGVPVGGLLYGNGKVGTYSAQFDGTSSFIEIQPVARTNFTVAMWVQTTNTGTGSTWYNGSGLVDGEMTGAAADWGCSVLNSRFALGIGNPDTTISTGISINDGNWHHLVATRDSISGLVKLYVDGALNAFGIAPTGPRTAPNDLRIGATHAAAPVILKGNIDDLRIYGRVLTDPEITILAGRAAYIGNIKTDGNNAVISGESGPPEGTYYVLSSTNLAVPLTQWSRETTNQFDENGNCSFTNTMNAGLTAKFYRLQLP